MLRSHHAKGTDQPKDELIDPKTGKAFFKPKVGRGNHGRQAEKAGRSIGEYLYEKDRERREKMNYIRHETDTQRKKTASTAQGKVNDQSVKYLEALRARRFRQIFSYILQHAGEIPGHQQQHKEGGGGSTAGGTSSSTTATVGSIDLHALVTGKSKVLESMDPEVRRDVQVACELGIKDWGDRHPRDQDKVVSKDKATMALKPGTVVPCDEGHFATWMDAAIRTSALKQRTYLLPVTRQREMDGDLTFHPQINPRSRGLAEARRPAGKRIEDFVMDEVKQRELRAQQRADEMSKAALKDCTFAPRLNENRSREGRAYKEAQLRAQEAVLRREREHQQQFSRQEEGRDLSSSLGGAVEVDVSKEDIEMEVLKALSHAKLDGGSGPTPGGAPSSSAVDGVKNAGVASGLMETLQQHLDESQRSVMKDGVWAD